MKTLHYMSAMAFGFAIAGAQVPIDIPIVQVGFVDLPRGRMVAPGKFLNLSMRGVVREGGDTLVAGFVADNTCVALIRVVGPSLSQLNILQPLSDPTAELFIGGKKVIGEKLRPWSEQSDLTKSTFRSISSKVGAFPLSEGSKDLVMLFETVRESYTIEVSASKGSGTVLLEVYLVPESVINGD